MALLRTALQIRCAICADSLFPIGFSFRAFLFQMMESPVDCSSTTHVFSFPIGVLLAREVVVGDGSLLYDM